MTAHRAVRAGVLRGNREGFTLIEVLIGLTVAALALGSAFAALSFVGDRSRAAEVAAVTGLEGAVAREMLVDWLSGARTRAPNRAGSFQGLDKDENGLDSDELWFPTTAMTPLQTRNSMVRLFIDVDRETPEQGLVAEMFERVQDEPLLVELIPQAGGLEIAFLPDVPEVTEWVPSWVGQRLLPKAVELRIEPVDGDSLPPLLRLPIRVALGTLR